MKAMILAAGMGTRLRPLTDDRPKALVEINGRTLLEIALHRLSSFGIREIVINVHHFADMIVEYLRAHSDFGMRIEVSREDVLLDTGGGLKNAAYFFLGNTGRAPEPFILHNVDVLSTIDLGGMLRMHNESNALVTLAVQHRKSSRYLLFDEQLRMRGRRTGISDEKDAAELKHQPLAFCGVHVISPRFLEMMTEHGAFSIITSYVRLASQGETIQAFVADEYFWRDLGRPENIEQAALDLQQRVITQ